MPLNDTYSFDAERELEKRSCFILRTDDHPTVDSYCLFRDACINGVIVDLLFFNQSRRVLDAGADLDAYNIAVPYCRSIVGKYQAQTKRRAGFIYGITNPWQHLSESVRRGIDKLSNTNRLEFFYAMGRSECIAHYDLLAGHPALGIYQCV